MNARFLQRGTAGKIPDNDTPDQPVETWMKGPVWIAEGLTKLVAGLTKVVGLVSATNQLLVTHHPSSLALAVSAVFVAGGQAVEGLLLTVLDRVFGQAPTKRSSGEEAAT